MFDPLPGGKARRVTLELFDAGCLTVSLEEEAGDRKLGQPEARAVLGNPANWKNTRESLAWR